MQYLINADCNSITAHLTRSDLKGFKKCCVSNAVDKTDGDILWNGSEEDGKVRSQCVENEGMNCEEGDRDIPWKM
jgi:hypothetical protein